MAFVTASNVIYLSQRTDIAQRTQLSPYFANTMRELFKNSMKPDINSIENTVEPDQLASEEAS